MRNSLTERDVITKSVLPALEKSGWNIQTQIFEEFTFTDGKITIVNSKPKRGERKRADIVLFYKPNIPLAIIEVKKNDLPIGLGIQQAIEYSEILDIPYAYSTNGFAFVEHSMLDTENSEIEISMNEFPSPDELYDRFIKYKGFSIEKKEEISTGYFFDLYGKKPRYYQRVAINRTFEAVISGKKRILLVMATGTGKTYTAFQIIHRLWKNRIKKRILFLADRNILIDQTMSNDFRFFGDKMTKIRNREVNKAYEIYLALYQGITGSEDINNIYKEFSKDFFDLIVIDECHRGSVREDSSWREVLDYFSSATQIGMTATPKSSNQASNLEYFGEPIYTYSLKQGIDDGFLAPYTVNRIVLDSDVFGFRPYDKQLDKYGNEIEDKTYGISDYDRKLVLEKRTKIVAKKMSDILKKQNRRFEKSIFFCVDIEHAERMSSALRSENSDLFSANSKYVMRITGDNKIGKDQLDSFIDPESDYPVLVTTSKLMTTGVDAQTCKNIIIDANINSIIEFKQIIGRGTRINEQFDKYYFNIYDFRGVTKLFSDPSFDGEPLNESFREDGPERKETLDHEEKDNEVQDKVRKYYIDDIEVSIIGEKISRYDEDGKLFTETIDEYNERIIKSIFEDKVSFWDSFEKNDNADSFKSLLVDKGFLLEEAQTKYGEQNDILTIASHIAFDTKISEKEELALRIVTKDFNDEFRNKFVSILMDIYMSSSIFDVSNIEVLRMPIFQKLGTPLQIVREFKGKYNYEKFLQQIIKVMYKEYLNELR